MTLTPISPQRPSTKRHQPAPRPGRWRTQLAAGMAEEVAREDRLLFKELNPHLEFPPVLKEKPATFREAAVLIPIIDRPGSPTVLFTLRSADLPSHAGQISFPGGRVEEADENMVATALRETHEEVGIPPHRVEVVGEMGVHFGGQGYAVTPVVGIIHPSTSFMPSPDEVHDLFEVPLDHLADEANHIIEKRSFGGVDYSMFAVPYEGWHIWGLTAGIVHTLMRVMKA